MFVDESGKADPKHGDNYTLSAFIIRDINLINCQNRIKELKNKFISKFSGNKQNDNNMELHAVDIFQGQNYFRSKPLNDRHQLAYDLVNLILSTDGYIISVVINEQKIYESIKTERWILQSAWKLLFERIEKSVKKRNVISDITEPSLIIMDSENHKADNRIRDLLNYFSKQPDWLISTDYIFPDPLFVDSRKYELVQVADFIAWIVRRHFSNYQSKYNDFYEDIFGKMSRLFETNKNGDYMGYGIKFYPK